MNGLRFMKRLCAVLGIAELVMLTWCLSLTLLMFFYDAPPVAVLLWSLLAAVPVLAIMFLCEKIEKPIFRFLAGFAVTLAATFLPGGIRSLVYVICCVIYTVIGAFLPRPDGKLLLTVPKFYHAVAILLCFAFTKIARIGDLTSAAILLALIFCVNFLLYQNTKRMLAKLRDCQNTGVNEQSIVALNRKLIFSLIAAGIVILIAVPFVLRNRPAQPEPEPEVYVISTETTQVPETTEETDLPLLGPLVLSPPGVLINWKPFEDATILLFALLALMLLGLIVLAVIALIGMLRDDKDRHRDPSAANVVIEKLPEEQAVKNQTAPPEDDRWSRKIRRQYQKVIRSKAAEDAALAALTPEELERAASLPETQDREVLHRLYEQARYSPEERTHEDYQAVKTAVKELTHL